MDLWNTFILNPLVNSMIWLYGAFGHNIIVAIIILTVLIRLLTIPLTMRQQKSMQATQALQPKLEEIKKKYKDQPEVQSQKTWEAYREAGVNPAGGCFPMLIQFPILIGLYQAITRSLAASPVDLLRLSQHIIDPLPAFLSWLPDAHDLIPLNNHFLWLNLAQPDPNFILPALVFISTFLQNKMMTPPSTDPNQAAMSRSMQLTMPIMIGWFSLQFPSGLSIYWIVSNIVGFVQYAAMGKASLKNLFGTEDGSFSLSGLLGLPTTPPEDSKDTRQRQRGSGSKSRSKK